MKAAVAVVGLVFAVGFAAAGAPTHEEVIKQMLSTLDKLTATLTTIKTEESADAAKPELQKAAKEWVALRGQAEKLPPPSRMEKERLEKDYKAKLEAAQKKIYGEVTRVQRIPHGPEALKEIRSVLDKREKK
jgi:hypothetical protein